MPRKRTRAGALPIEDAASSSAAAVGFPAEKRSRGSSRRTGLDATLERVLAATDWRSLFLAEAEGGASDRGSVEIAARAVRNRLVQVVHPDHVPLEHRLRATQAAQHLNMLWDQARRHFTGGASADSEADERAGGGRDPAAGDGSLTGAAAAAPGAMLLTGMEQPGGSLDLLLREVRAGRMIERREISTYVGFGATETLELCRFLPMATNRCISQDVVAQRVNENLTRLRERGSYANFGQISVVAVRQPATEQVCLEPADELGGSQCCFARFYVLDGQHRLRTMEQLRLERPDKPIWFELSVKVVDNKSAANEALLLMQNCYRADPRCFFSEDDEAELASRTLDQAKLTWPNAFSSSSAASFKRVQRPINRPQLDDGLFFDLLRDTHLLTAARGHSCPANELPKLLFDALTAVNDALEDIAEEHQIVADSTIAACMGRLDGCFLGLYRRDGSGRKIIEALKVDGKVPEEAICRLDEV